MTMTVGDLLEALGGVDDEVEVRLATQPSWPFEYSVKGLTLKSAHEDLAGGEEVAYLVEGEQIGYANGDLFCI